ncbi:hypothetical protein HJC23_011466 [Cyclotella cryptica]|uniref:[phosphatase 2A protein]-leucine-carboxy methyltransferase n=1 Tax=Cyclotella cryptica TaxID=29204 RepID=A0ABD3NTP8_9STRA|eukprot:CCRYP_019872-RA/>CCRYP_019872-RA protein AED:0.46 eAED:0.46 QI:0/-1/0/1/-1/1/1/0/473
MSSISDIFQNHDRAIIGTADRAILAKLSCVEKGYYDDPFLRPMSRGAIGSEASTARRGAGTASSMMEPIIRKGTHARVLAIDRAISAFLSLPLKSSRNNAKVTRQIVVLGSGRDTTYLRHRFEHLKNLHSNNTRTKDGAAEDSEQYVRWYEVDHPSVIRQKVTDWLPCCMPRGFVCESIPVPHGGENIQIDGPYESYVVSISGSNGGNDSLHGINTQTSNYHLIGFDLRDPPSNLFEILSHPQHGYDKSIPTFFILECVVMYLPEDASRELLRHLAESVNATEEHCNEDSFVAVAVYDPVPCGDRFGEVMIHNLQNAGIVGRRRQHHSQSSPLSENRKKQEHDRLPILSLESTRTVAEQLAKLIQCGFDTAVGCDMMEAYDHGIISMDDKRHAARCEMLDELEEFTLLMRHYCFMVGVKCSNRFKASTTLADVSQTMMKEDGGATTCVGFDLCSIGKNSPIGFQEGHCISVHK